jgi:hydrogenase maturation protein HypF
MEISGLSIHITGIIQGVGFRPFVYGLAKRLALNGWVRNTSAGVVIEIDGSPQSLDDFVQALKFEAPPLARIDQISVHSRPANGYTSFEIIHSEAIPHAFQPISPDVCICADCLRELFDPQDRRYLYPFINCTNCGPRYTIIQDIPYDRPNTTMSTFPLCDPCAQEYRDPLNRRFHAQPVACPDCGPHVWLEVSSQHNHPALPGELPGASKDKAILAAQWYLAQGKCVAIKGLGGFHLACDALNHQAVAELRTRKLRVDKPFALMMPDLATIETHCYLSDDERDLLQSRQRPVVILKRRPASGIADQVAPLQDTLGVMLPYTPLHYLLFSKEIAESQPAASQIVPDRPLSALVMTSGNLSEEPIAFDNEEARQRLSSLADAFLMHDRPIHIRCDDSVARVISLSPQSNHPARPARIADKQSIYTGKPANLILRRSRGYAPDPINIGWDSPPLLAVGGELKNVFCLARNRYAFLSHHIGDMENYETLLAFENGIQHFEHLFKIDPIAIAYDLHPNYLATRYALERAEKQNLPVVPVQHHHAHIAACMAENGLAGDEPVIGVAFDGTGYGLDGAIWGGEFLIADYENFQRVAHLAYTPLPGGDAAIRKPARTALAYLWKAGLDWDINLLPVQYLCAEERTAIRSQLDYHINAPASSSMGRLFDAVAALCGVRQQVNYEAQAAIELEALADAQESGSYKMELIHHSGEADEKNRTAPPETSIVVSPDKLLEALLGDLSNHVPVSRVSGRFHNGVAQMVLEVCQWLCENKGINKVVLSGGVWQNITLLEKTLSRLRSDQFDVYIHHALPPNDGGIALGQAAIAAYRLKS